MKAFKSGDMKKNKCVGCVEAVNERLRGNVSHGYLQEQSQLSRDT